MDDIVNYIIKILSNNALTVAESEDVLSKVLEKIKQQKVVVDAKEELLDTLKKDMEQSWIEKLKKYVESQPNS